MKKLLITIFLTFSLIGCSTPPPGKTFDQKAAERSVLAAKGQYELLLIVAKAYVTQELCTVSAPPCATLSVVRVIQKTVPSVRAALDAAELTVRTPGFGDDVYKSALTAAEASAGSFKLIVDSIKN